ncbi:hypothetical protein R4Z09_03565 [Niallia oryzisoli]|uniref:Ribbon-helix-helix protein CopG domain-containing protein n=1 Tax=Niallia oryzisoli TaxID=1737571 RepID=A0ABZ2CF28_9BACI
MMKAGVISLQQSIPFNLEQLIPFIKVETIENTEGLFIVRSTYRKTNLKLPIKMLDSVKQLAEQEDITISQWVECVINQALKQM